MQNCINIHVIIEKKMLTYFYENQDTSPMTQTTGELKLLTGNVSSIETKYYVNWIFYETKNFSKC